MGERGRGRNNQLSENGLLRDKDGNIFDLTQWYKDHSIDFMKQQLEALEGIHLQLKKINLHLASITDEIFTETDLEEEDI